MRKLKGRSIINVLFFLFWVAILSYSLKGLTLVGRFVHGDLVPALQEYVGTFGTVRH